MKMKPLMLVSLALLFSVVGHAKAGLIGSTVDVKIFYPDLNTLYQDYGQQAVNPTAFFSHFQETFTVSDSQIIFTAPSGSSGSFGTESFNGPVYDFLNSGNLISGLFLDPTTTLSGFSQSDITLTSDGAGGQLVELNVQGLNWNPSDNVTVDVATSVAAPEPSTLSLFGIGVAIVAWKRRRLTAA